jgi:hypothetical protein
VDGWTGGGGRGSVGGRRKDGAGKGDGTRRGDDGLPMGQLNVCARACVQVRVCMRTRDQASKSKCGGPYLKGADHPNRSTFPVSVPLLSPSIPHAISLSSSPPYHDRSDSPAPPSCHTRRRLGVIRRRRHQALLLGRRRQHGLATKSTTLSRQTPHFATGVRALMLELRGTFFLSRDAVLLVLEGLFL